MQDHDLRIRQRFRIQRASGHSADGIKLSGKHIGFTDHIKAEPGRIVPEMHGDSNLRLKLLHEFRRLQPVDGIKPADRDHADIQSFELRDLRLFQVTAQIPQMRDPQTFRL